METVKKSRKPKEYKCRMFFNGKEKNFFTEQEARAYAAKNNIASFTIQLISVIEQKKLFTLIKPEGSTELTISEIISLFKESIFFELYKGNPEFFGRGYYSTYLKDFIVNKKGLNARYNLTEFKQLADYIYKNQLL